MRPGSNMSVFYLKGALEREVEKKILEYIYIFLNDALFSSEIKRCLFIQPIYFLLFCVRACDSSTYFVNNVMFCQLFQPVAASRVRGS